MDTFNPHFISGFVKRCYDLGLSETDTESAFALLTASMVEKQADNKLLDMFNNLSAEQKGALTGAGLGGLGGLLVSRKNRGRNALLGALAGGGLGYGAGRFLGARDVDVSPTAFTPGDKSKPMGTVTTKTQPKPDTSFPESLTPTKTDLASLDAAKAPEGMQLSQGKPEAGNARARRLAELKDSAAVDIGTRVWATQELKRMLKDHSQDTTPGVGQQLLAGAATPFVGAGEALGRGAEAVGKGVDAASKSVDKGVNAVGSVVDKIKELPARTQQSFAADRASHLATDIRDKTNAIKQMLAQPAGTIDTAKLEQLQAELETLTAQRQ